MSNNGFVLVPKGGGNAVTDMDKKPINNLKEKHFTRQWAEVRNHLRHTGGCEAVMLFDNGSRDGVWGWSRNVVKRYHAEENLFIEQKKATLTVKVALITIEPCRDHRYGRNHNCYEFFMNGREVDGQLCRFVPAGPDTPVFYLEDQPARGKTSTVSSSLARRNISDVREYLANLGGVQWGVPAQNQSNKLWLVGGQEFMTAKEIFDALKKYKT